MDYKANPRCLNLKVRNFIKYHSISSLRPFLSVLKIMSLNSFEMRKNKEKWLNLVEWMKFIATSYFYNFQKN